MRLLVALCKAMPWLRGWRGKHGVAALRPRGGHEWLLAWMCYACMAPVVCGAPRAGVCVNHATWLIVTASAGNQTYRGGGTKAEQTSRARQR